MQGVLRDQADVEMLGDAFKREYAKRQALDAIDAETAFLAGSQERVPGPNAQRNHAAAAAAAAISGSRRS